MLNNFFIIIKQFFYNLKKAAIGIQFHKILNPKLNSCHCIKKFAIEIIQRLCYNIVFCNSIVIHKLSSIFYVYTGDIWIMIICFKHI